MSPGHVLGPVRFVANAAAEPAPPPNTEKPKATVEPTPTHADEGPLAGDAAAPPCRVMAVASAGGHWMQLKRIWPALEGHEVIFVSTHPGYQHEVGARRLISVTEANLNAKWRLARLAFEMLWHVLR
jgi:hypothetical protein